MYKNKLNAIFFFTGINYIMGESSGSPCQPCTPEWSKSLSRELEDVINRWDRGNIINNKYHVVIKMVKKKIKPINN